MMNSVLIEEVLMHNGTPYAKISHNPEESWMKVEWMGFQTEEKAKSGMNKYLELMKKHGIYKVLNDNRKQTGPYPKGIDAWIVSDWYPRALQFGIKAAATIMAEGVFTQLSAKQIETKVGNTVNKVFNNETEAKAWLEKV